MPHLQTFQKEYGDKGFVAIAIGSLTADKAVKKYVVEQALRGETPLFHVLKGGWKVYQAYGGKGAPNTFIIDRKGNVRFIHRAFNPGMEKNMKREIEALLLEG